MRFRYRELLSITDIDYISRTFVNKDSYQFASFSTFEKSYGLPEGKVLESAQSTKGGFYAGGGVLI